MSEEQPERLGPEDETGTPDEALVTEAPGTEDREHVEDAATEEAEVEAEEAAAVNDAAEDRGQDEAAAAAESADGQAGPQDAVAVADAEPSGLPEAQEPASDAHESMPEAPEPAPEAREQAETTGEPTLDLVDPDRLRRAVEAVLLVVDEPVEVTTLAQTLAVPKPDVLTALVSLRDEYDAGERGMDLREVAGGWRLYSREEFASYVERFVLDGQQTRLTQAALETLSVIAYRQPVTRSRVSAIRGVGVDGVMRTLTTRGLVEECGTDSETGGGLYRTTSLFLEKLGLNSLEELPPLAPLLPDHTDLDPALSDG